MRNTGYTVLVSILTMVLIILPSAYISAGEAGRMNKLLPVKELESIATKQMPEGGIGNSLPVATKLGSRLRIVVFWFGVSPQHRPDKVSPPQHIIEIDPCDGKIFRDESCSTERCGISRTLAPQLYIPITLAWDEYREIKELFYKMSPQIWALFETGSTTLDENEKKLTKDYYTAFKRITSKSLLPYYHAVAPDFYKWLEEVTK